MTCLDPRVLSRSFRETAHSASLNRRHFLTSAAGLGLVSRVYELFRLARVNLSVQRKIVVVTFGGGARDDETFAPEGQEKIPNLLHSLLRQATFYSQVINHGILGHYVATASLATGVYETFDNFASGSLVKGVSIVRASELTKESFRWYPPGARRLTPERGTVAAATDHIRGYPVREISSLDWRFPMERRLTKVQPIWRPSMQIWICPVHLEVERRTSTRIEQPCFAACQQASNGATGNGRHLI